MRQVATFRNAVAGLLLAALPAAAVAETVHIPRQAQPSTASSTRASPRRRDRATTSSRETASGQGRRDVLVDGHVVIEAGTVVWSEVRRARRAKVPASGVGSRSRPIPSPPWTTRRSGHDRSGRGRFAVRGAGRVAVHLHQGQAGAPATRRGRVKPRRQSTAAAPSCRPFASTCPASRSHPVRLGRRIPRSGSRRSLFISTDSQTSPRSTARRSDGSGSRSSTAGPGRLPGAGRALPPRHEPVHRRGGRPDRRGAAGVRVLGVFVADSLCCRRKAGIRFVHENAPQNDPARSRIAALKASEGLIPVDRNTLAKVVQRPLVGRVRQPARRAVIQNSSTFTPLPSERTPKGHRGREAHAAVEGASDRHRRLRRCGPHTTLPDVSLSSVPKRPVHARRRKSVGRASGREAFAELSVSESSSCHLRSFGTICS